MPHGNDPEPSEKGRSRVRPHVKARITRNRELAERDMAARCAQCRKPLLRVRLEMGERFCDQDCNEEYAAIRERLAELRAKVTR